MKRIMLAAFLLIISLWVVAQPNLITLFHSTYEEKAVAIDGNIKLSYAEQGDASGIPVLFVHGFPDSWHSYEEVLQELPKNIHAYAVSLRGFGNSDRPDATYSPQDFSKDLASFVNKLSIGPVILVGHSMGGLVVQRFAMDHPELTKGLVIIGSIASFSNHKDLKEFSTVINQLSDPIDEAFITEFQKGTIARSVNEQFFSTLINESKKAPAKVWKGAMNALVNYEPGKKLGSIRVPALIIWGDKDMICPRADVESLHRTLKGSRLLVYEGYGHSLQWEDPARFTKDIIAYIESLRIGKN